MSPHRRGTICTTTSKPPIHVTKYANAGLELSQGNDECRCLPTSSYSVKVSCNEIARTLGKALPVVGRIDTHERWQRKIGAGDLLTTDASTLFVELLSVRTNPSNIYVTTQSQICQIVGEIKDLREIISN